MATITTSREKLLPASIERPASLTDRPPRTTARWFRALPWLTLVAALVGFNLFVYQVQRVPQRRDYHANWYEARWITVANANSPTVYFRKTISLEARPDNAFLTVQAWQGYTLYVNGTYLDFTADNFRAGAVHSTYIYDVTPLLHDGANTVSLRVVNRDVGPAAVRAVLGISVAGHLQAFASDQSWRATSDSTLTQPFLAPTLPDWTRPDFSDAGWPNAAPSPIVPADGVIPFNPVTFETASTQSWLTAGPMPDAFFYRSLSLPAAREIWLRIASTGNATVFLNGHRLIDEPPRIGKDAAVVPAPNANTLTDGVYDVTPYLHAGENTFAVHISASTTYLGSGTTDTQAPAMGLDILLIRPNGALTHYIADGSWSAATLVGGGWIDGGGPTHWTAATLVGRSIFTALPPFKTPAPALQEVDSSSAELVIGLTTLLVLLFCTLGVGLQWLWRPSRAALPAALDRVALAFLPALGLIALLCVASLEPTIAHPFPFTPVWLGVLIGATLVSFALIFVLSMLAPSRARLAESARRSPYWNRLPRYAVGAAVITLALLAAYLVTYQLGYESYWEDELASIYAAKGVLRTGLPAWSTGVIYTKAELFSYMLAAIMAVFGDGPIALRMLSALEYIASVVLTFFIGRYLLGKRIGLLAMTLMVFSPLALLWGRQARMYQQAQLCVLLVLYLFYRAVQPGAKARYIYFSMLMTVVMYLSHEETFIVLPAMLLYFFVTQRLSWIRNRHWWIAGLSAIGVIGLQLVVWRLTRHPILGTDPSERPLVSFMPQNTYYYLRLLFAVTQTNGLPMDPYLGVTSTLAVIAGIGSLFSRDRGLRYVSLFFFVPLICLCLIFSLTTSRYILPLLPQLAMLASITVVRAGELVGRWARSRVHPVPARVITIAFTSLLVFTSVAGQVVPVSNFALAADRALGIPHQHRIPDYQQAGAYIRAHWQPGDVLISVVTSTDAKFYAETPSYTLYQGKALYVLQLDGHIVESYVGTQELLNEHDLAEVLAQHHRVWLMAATSRPCCPSGFRAVTDYNFALVWEGFDSMVYLRSG